MRNILFLLTITLITACQKHPYDEEYFYKDGTLKAKIEHYNSNGKRSAFNYLSNGNLFFVYHWENSNNDGLVIHYDSSEVKMSELHYINNLVSGPSTYFYPSGNTYAQANFTNNMRQGWAYTFYDSQDSLIMERQYYEKDSLIFAKRYNERSELLNSILPIRIQQIESRKDSVKLKIELLVSNYNKIAMRIEQMVEPLEFQTVPYYIFSDSLSMYHWYKLSNEENETFEGMLFELVEYELKNDPETGDSILIPKYGGAFNFNFELK